MTVTRHQELTAVLVGGLSGLSLLFLSPFASIGLLLGLVFVAVALQWPYQCLLAFVFMACCLPYSAVSAGIRITISELLLALAVSGVLLGALWSDEAFRTTPTVKAVIALMVFSTIPLVVGAATPGSKAAVVNWVRWLMSIGCVLLAVRLVDRPSRRDRLIDAMMAGTSIMVALSLYNFAIDPSGDAMTTMLESLAYPHSASIVDIFGGTQSRLASPWVHPNLLGGLLAMLVPVYYGVMVSARGWRRVAAVAALSLAVVGLLLSISRGAILSAGLVALAFLFLRVPNAGKLVVLTIVSATALVLSYEPLQDRLSTMFSSTNASSTIRVDEYRMFPEAVATYPMGIGFGIDPPIPGTDLIGISNLWLNYIYKLGAVGALLFVVVTLAWWQEVRPRRRLRFERADDMMHAALLGGVLAALLTGFFDHYFSFSPVLIAVFWLLVGLSVQSAQWVRAPQPSDPPRLPVTLG